MKRRLVVLGLAAAVLGVLPRVAAAQEKPVRVAYYYKVRWGFQQEFERLFLKNHYPLLAAQAKEGTRVRSVELYRPTFHGDGHGDWTFLVAITYTSWAAIGAPSGEADLARKLFPDQETYKREEQRRFEILDAHWDVPLTEVEAKP
jgi:hypothetical protein